MKNNNPHLTPAQLEESLRKQAQGRVGGKKLHHDPSKAEARARSLANLRPFRKGHSIKSPGRPRKDRTLETELMIDAAQDSAKKALDALLQIVTNDRANPHARVAAAAELLDRGFGKAKQQVDLNATMTISDEFEQFVRTLTHHDDVKMIEARAKDVTDLNGEET